MVATKWMKGSEWEAFKKRQCNRLEWFFFSNATGSYSFGMKADEVQQELSHASHFLPWFFFFVVEPEACQSNGITYEHLKKHAI